MVHGRIYSLEDLENQYWVLTLRSDKNQIHSQTEGEYVYKMVYIGIYRRS